MQKKTNNFWMIKIGNKYKPSFIKEKLDWVREQRVKKGKDKISKTRPYPRLLLAAVRDEEFLNRLINADLIEDKDGQFNIFNLFNIMITAFIAVLMFGGLIYVSGILNTTFQDIGLNNEANAGNAGYVNLTKASNDTFGQMNNSIQALRLVAITLIFSLILGTILVNALMKFHPAFFFIYILIVGLAVMFAAPISNAYLNIEQSNVYEGLLTTFTGSRWFLLNLPLVIAITGIIGGLFLFINITRIGTEVSI